MNIEVKSGDLVFVVNEEGHIALHVPEGEEESPVSPPQLFGLIRLAHGLISQIGGKAGVPSSDWDPSLPPPVEVT